MLSMDGWIEILLPQNEKIDITITNFNISSSIL